MKAYKYKKVIWILEILLRMFLNFDPAACSIVIKYCVRLDIMWLIILKSKMEMSVINKMANVFVVNFITGEPWNLTK